MKKLVIIFALLFSSACANATPGTGGYLGHRIIVAGEFAYSPFFTSVKDFFTMYNFQYGGNLNVIVGRRTQVGLDYNMWSLGGNQQYEGNFVKSDRVKGTEYGITVRTFRKKRGGLAPIGKFWDIGMSYAQNEFKPGSDNKYVLANETAMLPKTSDQLMLHVGWGSQMVFWNRVVANTGIRFGAPVYEVSKESGIKTTEDGTVKTFDKFLYNRLMNKEYFSVFFGVGILL
jgi:hypothetical protein